MRRNISSVLVVIVGVLLAVDVATRLAPQEATAQEDFADRYQRQKALDDIARALEEQNLRAEEDRIREEHLRRKAAAATPTTTTTTTIPIFPRAPWANDLEIVSRKNYYILWSDGSVTNGGTLPTTVARKGR